MGNSNSTILAAPYERSDGCGTPIPQQLSLFNPADEVSLYQPQLGGFFSLLKRTAPGTVIQHSYPVRELERVLSLVDVLSDTYVSQAQFWTPFRRVVNVKAVSLVFLDVDCYKASNPWAEGRTPEEMAEAFMSFCDSEGIPRPSLIIFSGRGLQPKWLLSSPLPRAALPRWNAVQKSLTERFEQYGADPMARDAARVLRVVQTTNTKSGLVCRVVATTQDADGLPVVYGFDFLSEFALPYSRDELEHLRDRAEGKKVQRRANPANGFSLQTLNWARLEDLRMLLKLRRGIEEGMRMTFLMYMMNFLALSGQVTLATFFREAACLASEIDPAWNCRSEELRTVYAKFKDALAGKKVSVNGREVTPLYTPRTDTLVNLFRVTHEEMLFMKTLISDDVRRERHRVSEMNARRAAGAIPRAEYEGRSDARAERARELRQQGLSIRGIAAQMQVSKTQVQRYLAQVSHVRAVI